MVSFMFYISSVRIALVSWQGPGTRELLTRRESQQMANRNNAELAFIAAVSPSLDKRLPAPGVYAVVADKIDSVWSQLQQQFTFEDCEIYQLIDAEQLGIAIDNFGDKTRRLAISETDQRFLATICQFVHECSHKVHVNQKPLNVDDLQKLQEMINGIGAHNAMRLRWRFDSIISAESPQSAEET